MYSSFHSSTNICWQALCISAIKLNTYYTLCNITEHTCTHKHIHYKWVPDQKAIKSNELEKRWDEPDLSVNICIYKDLWKNERLLSLSLSLSLFLLYIYSMILWYHELEIDFWNYFIHAHRNCTPRTFKRSTDLTSINHSARKYNIYRTAFGTTENRVIQHTKAQAQRVKIENEERETRTLSI